MQTQRLSFGSIALIVALTAILIAALWFAARAWIALEGPPMPAVGYVAMILGVVISLIVGCGLMALVFYSSRYGCDEVGYDELGHHELGNHEVGYDQVGQDQLGHREPHDRNDTRA
jgi:hypothetical protein